MTLPPPPVSSSFRGDKDQDHTSKSVAHRPHKTKRHRGNTVVVHAEGFPSKEIVGKSIEVVPLYYHPVEDTYRKSPVGGGQPKRRLTVSEPLRTDRSVMGTPV